MCPQGSESWCGYHRKKDYKHKAPLPKAVAVAIKPVFDRLSANSLLERCVDGFTQNAAESFNSVLWNICPKRTFVGSASINLCAGLAVIVYNDGQQELGKLLKKLGINIGIQTKAALSMQDNQRVQLSIKRTSEKKRRLGKPKGS